MIGDDLPLLRAHDTVLLFLAYKNLFNCVKEVLLAYIFPAFLDRIYCSFVDHIGKIGTYGTACCKGNGIEIHALVHLNILRMDLEYLDSSLKIRLVNNDTSVKTAGSQKCLIEYLGAVCCSEDQYSL